MRKSNNVQTYLNYIHSKRNTKHDTTLVEHYTNNDSKDDNHTKDDKHSKDAFTITDYVTKDAITITDIVNTVNQETNTDESLFIEQNNLIRHFEQKIIQNEIKLKQQIIYLESHISKTKDKLDEQTEFYNELNNQHIQLNDVYKEQCIHFSKLQTNINELEIHLNKEKNSNQDYVSLLSKKDDTIHSLNKQLIDKQNYFDILKSNIDDLQKQLDKEKKLNSTISSQYETNIKEKDGYIQSLMNSLIKYETIIKQNESTIKNHELTIKEHESTIKEHESSIKKHESTIKKHESTIKEHESTIKEHESTIKNHESTIKEHESTIKNHESTIKEHESTIKNHESTIKEHESTIKYLNTFLEKKSLQIVQLQEQYNNQVNVILKKDIDIKLLQQTNNDHQHTIAEQKISIIKLEKLLVYSQEENSKKQTNINELNNIVQQKDNDIQTILSSQQSISKQQKEVFDKLNLTINSLEQSNKEKELTIMKIQDKNNDIISKMNKTLYEKDSYIKNIEQKIKELESSIVSIQSDNTNKMLSKTKEYELLKNESDNKEQIILKKDALLDEQLKLTQKNNLIINNLEKMLSKEKEVHSKTIRIFQQKLDNEICKPIDSKMFTEQMTIVYQYNYKHGRKVTGFGDLLRGCYYALQLTSRYGISVEFYVNHPLKNCFQYFQDDVYLSTNITNNIDFFTQTNHNYNYKNGIVSYQYIDIDRSVLETIKHIPRHNGSKHIYLTNHPNESLITEKHTNYIKHLFTPITSIINDAEENMKQLDIIPQEFITIHLRLSDDCFHKKYESITTDKINYIVSILSKITSTTKSNIFLLSNDNNVKSILLSQMPTIKTIYYETTHVADQSINNDVNLRNTIIEFYMMGQSKSIYSFSVYDHGSGFSKWCSVTYNIPYICFKI
jgi:hypothetical protein